MQTMKNRALTLLATLAVAAAGCQGDKGPAGNNGAPGKDGTNGVNGTDGTNGTNGTNGANGTNGTNGAPGAPGAPGANGTTTPPGLANQGLVLKFGTVTVSAAGAVTVPFSLADANGFPVDVNGKYSVNTAISPRFALANVTPNADGSVPAFNVLTKSGNPASPTAFSPARPGQTVVAANGTLTEVGSGAGTYQYVFPASVVADAASALTHTVWVQITRQTDLDDTQNTKTFTALNARNDFIPSGSGTIVKRELVLASNCDKCHAGFKAEALTANGFHGAGRVEATFCNVCHSPARNSGKTNSDGATPVAASNIFVHRIHAGKNIADANVFDAIGEATYPRDLRDCAVCHAGAAQGDQAYSKPTRATCGSCHDYVDFSGSTSVPKCTDPVTLGANGKPLPCFHLAGTGVTQDDTQCAGCHKPAGIPAGSDPAAIKDAHTPVAPPDPNNSLLVTGGNANTNAAYLAAAGIVPPGATQFSYVVKSVGVVSDANVTPAVLRPQITFKLQSSVNGSAPADVVFNTFGGGKTELLDGFVGSPSVYFAFAMPQDGIAKPADFNASQSGYIKNIWNGSATGTGGGTMTGPDASGFYTITLGLGVPLKTTGTSTTGSQAGVACVAGVPCTCTVAAPCQVGAIIPANAGMLTGGVGYTYSLSGTPPLVQLGLQGYPYDATTKVGGLLVPARDVWVVGSFGATTTSGKAINGTQGATTCTAAKPCVCTVAAPCTGFNPRRQIVDSNKCDACHGLLGANPTFHAGQRNDGATCSFCHNPNQNNNGWSGNVKDMIHSLHAGTAAGATLPDGSVSPGTGKRTYPYTWHAESASAGFWEVTFPSRRNNCEACHATQFTDAAKTIVDPLKHTFDFSAADSIDALPNLLWSTDATGTAPVDKTDLRSGVGPLAGGVTMSPYVVQSTIYGANFAIDKANGVNTQDLSLNAPGNVTTGNNNLMTSPITAACVACHDSPTQKAHIIAMNGQFYVPRSVAKGLNGNTSLTDPNQESCLICHGSQPNAIVPIADFHKQ